MKKIAIAIGLAASVLILCAATWTGPSISVPGPDNYGYKNFGSAYLPSSVGASQQSNVVGAAFAAPRSSPLGVVCRLKMAAATNVSLTLKFDVSADNVYWTSNQPISLAVSTSDKTTNVQNLFATLPFTNFGGAKYLALTAISNASGATVYPSNVCVGYWP